MTPTTSTGLRIDVLGPLRAERGGIEVDLGGPKQRAVLAMLVSEPVGSLGRDRIIEGVWGEEASDANRHSFYTYLSNLRSVLGDVIVRAGEAYRLAVEPGQIDHVAFAAAVDEARPLMATDPGAAAVALRAALGLWRGRPYADLTDVPGLDPAVRRLEELRLEAVELRIDSELAAGFHGALVAELEALAEEYPLRERFRAQHMLALYRSGRQSDALRAYRRTETLLAEELGVEPSEELRDLELKILEHDDSLLAGPGRIITQRLAFLVTTIADSTRLWDRHPQSMATALATHDRLLREAIEEAGGRLYKHTGNGVLAVFPDAVAATQAAEAAQRALEAADWGEVGVLRVRMGIDAGEAEARGGDFFGPPLTRGARLCAIGHGGQVLVSAAAQTEVVASAPAGVQIRQLGEFQLRGMASPERVAQLVFGGLPADFPELRVDAESPLDEGAEIASLPGYEVRDRIGEGALGVVWRAYQPSVGREVAIKVIRPELASQPSFVRRFEAEARTIARLAHPHIVPMIDFWRDATSAYLVLGLLAGGSLASALASGSLDRAASRRILVQVGAALDHAHSQGMVHGDVKPANVLLDSSGNAYLSDFGIAARLIDADLVSSVSTYRAPEEASTGPTSQADLYALGVLAGKLLGGQPESDAVIARATAARPEDRHPTAAAFLADLWHSLGAEPIEGAPTGVSRNPYKGLRAFDEGDAADFYGRDELVASLVAAVSEHRFVTVVGPSGSGKSSVVQAGLLAELAAGALEESNRWFRVVLTPGSDPVEALAEALGKVSSRPVSPDELAQGGLTRAVEEHLLVVVDQFEEVYTLADPGRRRKFVELLVDAVEDRQSSLRVVVTLRADFYDRPLEDERLGRLVRDGLVTVLPPSREEMVEMITAPALVVGLRWEPGLPHRIADDVAQQPGGLPLLQYALTELVENRSGDLLTGGDYTSTGGVAGALANRAEAVFGRLTPAQQRAARQVLLRLVTVDEETDDTRRRVRRSELDSIGIARGDLEMVLDTFTSQRLLLADRDAATRSPTVEVAHEALLREWPRLAAWVDDQREGLILGRRFRASLTDWERNERHDDYLLTGSRLAPFTSWAETSSLTLEEQGYYRASRDKDEEQRNARRRRRRTLTSILASAAVVASTLGILAAVQATRATAEAELARARELSAAAQAVLDTDPSLAKLLAVASADLAEPTVNTLSVLHQAYARDPVIDRYVWSSGRGFLTTDLHPDGTRLVASSSIPEPVGYLEVYDFDREETIWSYETGHPSIIIEEARFSPDGIWVVAGLYWQADFGSDQAPLSDRLGIHIWDAETGELIRRHDLGRCGGKVHDIAAGTILVTSLDPEGCTAPQSGGIQFTVEVVDVETGARRILAPHARWDATMSADGQFVAFTEFVEEGRWKTVVVEVATGERVLEFSAPRPLDWAGARLLSPDGSLLIVGIRTMEVWDVAERQRVATFAGHTQEATPWTFSPDGLSVYSTGADFTLRIWDATRGRQTAAYPAVGQSRASIAEHGRVLVTDPASQQAYLLDLTPGEVWGVPSCGGFIIGRSLKVVGGHAVFSEFCSVDERGTQVVDVIARQIVTTFPDNHSQDVAISPDGTRFVRQEVGELPQEYSEGREDLWTVSPPRIRDLPTGELVVELDGVCTWDSADATPAFEQPGCARFPNPPFALWNEQIQWSPDSTLVAAISSGAIEGGIGQGAGVAVWNAENGELVSTLEPCRQLEVTRILFTADGNELLLACSSGGLLLAYSTDTWEQTRSFILDKNVAGRETFVFVTHDPAQSVVLGLGGTLLGGHAALHWLDEESLAVVHSINRAHDGPVASWATSPDGSLAATGSNDGVVKVWNVAERRLTQEIFVGPQVQGVAFIDNNHLAVTPQTGGLYVYTLDPDELLNIVRASLTRGLTELECQQNNFGDACPTLEELRANG